jgi:hypothetical protein
MGKFEDELQKQMELEKPKEKKKFYRRCLGSDCNEAFETTNRCIRLCYNCRKSEVFKYGSLSSDDFYF